MALIKCPECGKEISDTCDTCIHCGYKLHPENNTVIKKASANHRLVIILVCVVIAIGIIIASVLIVNSVRENNRIKQEKQEQVSMQQEEIETHKLSYEEKVCYYAIEYFKTILKNPENLQINSLKIGPTITADVEGKDSNGHFIEYMVVVDYSAQNGFGGFDRNNYYITMSGTTISSNNSMSQEVQALSYIDAFTTTVNTDKIKYALDHPEVLDY